MSFHGFIAHLSLDKFPLSEHTTVYLFTMQGIVLALWTNWSYIHMPFHFCVIFYCLKYFTYAYFIFPAIMLVCEWRSWLLLFLIKPQWLISLYAWSDVCECACVLACIHGCGASLKLIKEGSEGLPLWYFSSEGLLSWWHLTTSGFPLEVLRDLRAVSRSQCWH